MTIRAATLADRDDIITLLREFQAITPYATHEISDQKFEEFVSHYLNPRPFEHIILLYEKDGKIEGLLAGMVTSGVHWFSENKCAAELAWYVRPSARQGTGPIRLLMAYEKWAKLVGCCKVSMMVIEGDSRQTLSKMYRKLGYESTEETFVREI